MSGETFDAVAARGLFRMPGLFLTDGIDTYTRDDVSGVWRQIGQLWTPEQLVDRAANAGFRWVAQQYGSPDGRPDSDPALVQRMRERCHERGVYFLIWEVAPRSLDTLEAVKPNGWVLNVEDDYFDYGPLLDEFRRLHPRLPAGVVTNCGLNPAPFIRHNVKALPEAYLVTQGNLTPFAMWQRCKEMGWRVAFPVLGVYHGFPLAGYTRYGEGWSIYLAEQMQDTDWSTATAWKGTA